MREKFFTISEIERLMAGSLDGAQMERLHAVLTHCLLGQEDFPAADSGSLNNTEMLDAFFGAKAVEGCSPRSIKYYTITLKRFAAGIDKPFAWVPSRILRTFPTAS